MDQGNKRDVGAVREICKIHSGKERGRLLAGLANERAETLPIEDAPMTVYGEVTEAEQRAYFVVIDTIIDRAARASIAAGALLAEDVETPMTPEERMQAADGLVKRGYEMLEVAGKLATYIHLRDCHHAQAAGAAMGVVTATIGRKEAQA